jgi:hypothetical protein
VQLDLDPAGTEFQVVVINLDLRDGAHYFMRISATNGAGLEGFRWTGRRRGGAGVSGWAPG